MIACICKAITEKDIEQCIKDCSHFTNKDVLQCLNIGSSCGICKKEVEQIIDKIRNELCQKNC